MTAVRRWSPSRSRRTSRRFAAGRRRRCARPRSRRSPGARSSSPCRRRRRAGEEIDDGGEMTSSETVSEVDLDQIFNTLSPKTIRDFKHVIQGFELSYEGVARQANRGLRYLNPFLSHLAAGLRRARRRPSDLREPDRRHLRALRGARGPGPRPLGPDRQPRPDDERARRSQASSSPSRSHCSPTSCETRTPPSSTCAPRSTTSTPWSMPPSPRSSACARSSPSCGSPPTTRCRRSATSTGSSPTPAPTTTWSSSPTAQPALAKAAVGSGSPDCGPGPETPPTSRSPPTTTSPRAPSARAVCALRNGNPQLSYFRAYTPELVGWFDDFSHSGYVDAIGGIGPDRNHLQHLHPLAAGQPAERLRHPADPRGDARLARSRQQPRCPGGNERPAERPRRRLGPVHRRRRAHRRQPGQRRVRARARCSPAHEKARPDPLRVHGRHRRARLERRCRRRPHLRDRDVQRLRDRRGLRRPHRRRRTRAASPISAISADKTAIVTVELTGELGTLGQDSVCSSEPQSLIAEYFITCQPSGPPIEEDDDAADPKPDIPAEQVEQTVQNDLVQNTLREPFAAACGS